MGSTREKLYCYVDETGQDTKGAIFIVAAIISDGEQSVLEKFLLGCEKASGKGIKKWTHTPSQVVPEMLKREIKTSSELLSGKLAKD